MAYKKKKKFHYETPEERAWIEDKLNAYKRWHKPYKGEIVVKTSGLAQEFVLRSSYNSKEELVEDAKKMVDSMNALDVDREWKLVSAKLVGQDIDDGLL